MGDFTQNLLKLTEFPFSYSLIGLIALIYGQGISPDDLSFAKIGPLLILMGFVATTLSICDPMGAIQKIIIKGKNLETADARTLLNRSIFGMPIHNTFGLANLCAILGRPEHFKNLVREEFRGQDLKKGFQINWQLMMSSVPLEDKLGEFQKINVSMVSGLLEGMKEATLKTKWITAEIDRINALLYFIIVICVFIFATQYYSDFLPKFTQHFQDIESTRIVILIFSISALIAVCYMFLARIYGPEGLQRKASIVYRYLYNLQQIKIDTKYFGEPLDKIESYLNDNHWTLALYWVTRVRQEYTRLFLEDVRKSTSAPPTPK